MRAAAFQLDLTSQVVCASVDRRHTERYHDSLARADRQARRFATLELSVMVREVDGAFTASVLCTEWRGAITRDDPPAEAGKELRY